LKGSFPLLFTKTLTDSPETSFLQPSVGEALKANRKFSTNCASSSTAFMIGAGLGVALLIGAGVDDGLAVTRLLFTGVLLYSAEERFPLFEDLSTLFEGFDFPEPIGIT